MIKSTKRKGMKFEITDAQKKEKLNWNSKIKCGDDIYIKYARDLPDDAPNFILKRFRNIQLETAKFCLDDYCNGLILDIGCGVGDFLISARNLLSDDIINYIGIDLSRNVLNIATERIEAKTRANFIESTMTNIPLKDNTINKIICVGNVITYLGSLTEVDAALNEFFRILKPGGIIILGFSNRSSYTASIMRLMHKKPPEPHKLISPLWLIKGMKNIGFVVYSYYGIDFKPIQGRLFATKWRYLDSEFIESISGKIEKRLIPSIPLLSFLAGTIYIKFMKVGA